MTATRKSVSLHGVIYGSIWMPNCECWKEVSLGESDFRYSDNSRPTIRDFALQATNDGDFQGTDLTASSYFEFSRVRRIGDTVLKRTRYFDVTYFASTSDCVGEKETSDFGFDD